MKAIIGIDIQNDFVKGGALAYGYPKEDIVPAIAAYLKERKAAGDFVVLTADTHGTDYLDSLEGRRLPVPHCIEGTGGHDFPPDLDGVGANEVVHKPTFGSFLVKEYMRDAMYAGKEIEEIVLIGGCTSICLLANAVILRAAFPNKKIAVKQGLCFDIDEASHRAALLVLKNQQIDIV